MLSIFDLTTESLNDSQWQPKKNYDTGKLNISVLGEMPALSNLLIDESNIQQGTIFELGLNNVKSIGSLIEEQQISYDFQYYSQDLPTNVACLIVGEGRSMFKNSIHMPCAKDA